MYAYNTVGGLFEYPAPLVTALQDPSNRTEVIEVC